jgi:hypothetical protein
MKSGTFDVDFLEGTVVKSEFLFLKTKIQRSEFFFNFLLDVKITQLDWEKLLAECRIKFYKEGDKIQDVRREKGEGRGSLKSEHEKEGGRRNEGA